jgi:peroxiredoxin
MASRTEEKRAMRERRREQEAQARQAKRARDLRNRVLMAVGAAVVVLAVIFAVSQSGGGGGGGGGGSSSSSSSSGGGGKFKYAVGSPGPGQAAPALDLPSTKGGQFNLAAMRGKTVLLYFQEGLTCQPCWDQLKDLEKQSAKLRALGITEMASITNDSLGDLKTKASDEGLSTPVLSDGNLSVSKTYSANQYGMMGDSRDGHSFVIVGPDGKIRWRADYGGSPNYTMYVPVARLLSDMRKGLHGAV